MWERARRKIRANGVNEREREPETTRNLKRKLRIAVTENERKKCVRKIAA